MHTKKCRKCGIEYPIDTFYINVRYKDGRYTWCKHCFVEAKKKNITKEQKNSYAKSSHHRRKALGIAYLGGVCSVCGIKDDPCIYDFHHKDPAQKEYTITQRIRWKSFDKIKRELDKCILVCSNCHRKLHINGVGKQKFCSQYQEYLNETKQCESEGT